MNKYDFLTNELNIFLDKFIRKYIYNYYLFIKKINFKKNIDEITKDIIEYVLCNDDIKKNISKFNKIYNIFYSVNNNYTYIIGRIVLFLLNNKHDAIITLFYNGNINNDKEYNSIIKLFDNIFI